MPSDLENRSSQSDAEERDDENKSQVDYESKYRGQVRAYDKLKKKFDDLQSRLDDESERHEEELAKATMTSKDFVKQLKELQNQLDSEKAERSKLEMERARDVAKSEARKLIADKYNNLLEAYEAGDLRSREEFTSQEDYVSYLERQTKRFSPSVQNQQTEDRSPSIPNEFNEQNDLPPVDSLSPRRRYDGFYPSINPGTRESSQQRSLEDLVDAREKLDARNPAHRQEIARIEQEMDKALAQRNRR